MPTAATTAMPPASQDPGQAHAQQHLVLRDQGPQIARHGTSMRTSVAPARGARHGQVPSKAASRRDPRSGRDRPGRRRRAHRRPPSAAAYRRRGRRRTQARVARGVLGRRWPGIRRPRSRPPTRPAGRAGQPQRDVTGMGIGMASASMPATSPRSARTGGWIPRTSVRRSSSALIRSSRGLPQQRDGRVGVGVDQLLGQPHVHARGGDPGLRAVVQVALDAAQLGLVVVDRRRAGLDDLVDPRPQPLAARVVEDARSATHAGAHHRHG